MISPGTDASGASLPRTDSSISRQSDEARSRTIFLREFGPQSLAPLAIFMASRALVMPTDEPARPPASRKRKAKLLANQRQRTRVRDCSWHWERGMAMKSPTGAGLPVEKAAFRQRLYPSLPAVAPAHPSRRREARRARAGLRTVPSSPKVPVQHGKDHVHVKRSFAGFFENSTSAAVSGSAVNATCWPERSTSGSIFCADPPASQRPALVIPIGTASYRSGSSARITEAAEASDTSCSPERPPKITPTRSRFFSDVMSCARLVRVCYRIFFPRAESTISTPSSAVLLSKSITGLISTISSDTIALLSAIISIARCPSR